MYYKISFPEPNDRLFHVDLTIDNWQKDVLDVKMPVWTPGSYLVREYARHLRDFQATADGKPLIWLKITGGSIPMGQIKSSLIIEYLPMN
jgi:predicted metalloprotease with PDZ domain